VQGGVVVALRDWSGKSLGALREPWSLYTVEGLLDAVAQSARRVDVLGSAPDLHPPAFRASKEFAMSEASRPFLTAQERPRRL